MQFEGGVAALLHVVALQSLAQASRFHPHDGITRRVEHVDRTIEYLQCEHRFLQRAKIARHRLLHQMPEKNLMPG